MNEFRIQTDRFWREFGMGKKMVLSTSFNDHVTSRMMSIVQKEGILYFQTDKTFRKYTQLAGNENAALCIDNIQMEGVCTQLGHPADSGEFCRMYRECFPSSFERYTALGNERLFEFRPVYIKRWVYRDGEPYEEIYNIREQKYNLVRYKGE